MLPLTLAALALASPALAQGPQVQQGAVELPHLDARSLPAHARALRPRIGRIARPAKRSPPAFVEIGGVELQVNEQRRAASMYERRAGNGSIIALGSAHSTYAIPVGLGDPGIAYPLQLDTGSADLYLASSLCGSNCPAATDQNPYYDVKFHSNSFIAVNGNQTAWTAPFGDGSRAAGFVARERVMISSAAIEGQVFGLITNTNLTLNQQRVSGMLGLGFPRLSAIARIMMKDSVLGETVHTAAGATGSSSLSGSASSTSSSAAVAKRQAGSSSATPSPAVVTAAAAAPAGSAYLPPLLESLFSKSIMPCPVFGLALSPPLNGTSPAAKTSEQPRYKLSTGSLTIGGVSEQYVSNDTSTGRTVNDIEWHPVVPFGPLTSSANASSSASSSAGVTAPAGVPASAAQLEEEQYLYWALQLSNIAVNGTAIGVQSTYATSGLPSVALLDVGSNGIYGPQQDVQRLFQGIPFARQVAEGQWAVPCDTKETLGFSFGGRYVQVQPTWPVAVPSAGDGIDWQLGTPFLRSVYSVFSYGINGVQAPQIGFLPLNDTAPGSNTSTATKIIPAAPTQTVATVLPNQLLPSLSYPTPSYMFAPGPSTGAIQTMGLANGSAYAVTSVPVVSLPRLRPSTSNSAVPDVPGWPGDSAEHNSSALHLGISMWVLVLALIGACIEHGTVHCL